MLAIEVTRENVSDGRMLKPLVEDSAGKTDLKRVVADGAYDSKGNSKLLADKGIEPVIRVRKNASSKAGGCILHKIEVVAQLGNPQWKKEKGYGYRWMAE